MGYFLKFLLSSHRNCRSSVSASTFGNDSLVSVYPIFDVFQLLVMSIFGVLPSEALPSMYIRDDRGLAGIVLLVGNKVT